MYLLQFLSKLSLDGVITWFTECGAGVSASNELTPIEISAEIDLHEFEAFEKNPDVLY